MYAKYSTVYFCGAIKFDARVANLILLYYSNVNVLRNDNNVARVKSKRIETSICSIINIELSTPIFGLPMVKMAKLCSDHPPKFFPNHINFEVQYINLKTEYALCCANQY